MFHLISSEKDLESLDKVLFRYPYVAVDTEFRRTGKDKIELALIQVNNSEETFIIDCVSLGKYRNNCKFLFSKNIIKIFHSFKEDLEAIFFWTQSHLENIFDTQLANAFLGGSYSVGYQDLVYEKLDVLVDKRETRSNWIKRPLRDSQLIYAASDVQFLIEIFLAQKKDLEKSGKIDWFKEEIDFVSKKIFFNEAENGSNRGHQKLSKIEERSILKDFSKLVLIVANKQGINPTMLFSKKGQKDFLKKCLFYGFNSASETIPKWKRHLLSDDLHLMFKDYFK